MGDLVALPKRPIAEVRLRSSSSIGSTTRREQHREQDVGVEDESHPRCRRSARVARTWAAISLREKRRRFRETLRWIASTAARRGLPACGAPWMTMRALFDSAMCEYSGGPCAVPRLPSSEQSIRGSMLGVDASRTESVRHERRTPAPQQQEARGSRVSEFFEATARQRNHVRGCL